MIDVDGCTWLVSIPQAANDEWMNFYADEGRFERLGYNIGEAVASEPNCAAILLRELELM